MLSGNCSSNRSMDANQRFQRMIRSGEVCENQNPFYGLLKRNMAGHMRIQDCFQNAISMIVFELYRDLVGTDRFHLQKGHVL